MFAFEKPSDADPKTAISSALALMARSSPFSFGVNAVKATPDFLLIPAITCSPSAICGTHLELTKLAVSIFGIPLVDNRFTSFTLSEVLINLLSF